MDISMINDTPDKTISPEGSFKMLNESFNLNLSQQKESTIGNKNEVNLPELYLTSRHFNKGTYFSVIKRNKNM